MGRQIQISRFYMRRTENSFLTALLLVISHLERHIFRCTNILSGKCSLEVGFGSFFSINLLLKRNKEILISEIKHRLKLK